MQSRLTTDADGNEVRDGDLIFFAYGIPPVGVEARVVNRSGKLVALTPGHKPSECDLSKIKKHVGEFYKVVPKREGNDEIEARIFAGRAALAKEVK